jgi:BirA family biotin operon repressor/biotin-[acetyl-CoA-carboxylase] ligase
MDDYLKIINLDEVDSTNDYLAGLAREGAKEITVVTAKSQSKGKGRQGRVWVSPAGAGVYLSFLLRPKNPLKEVNLLPLLFGLGVARALSGIVAAKIKYPNDLLVNGKKICGILVETRSLNDEVEFVIAGVGVNVNSKQEEIPEQATSLFLETGKKYDVSKLTKRIIKEEVGIYRIFKSDSFNGLIEEANLKLKKP